jgi:hypothetical protein
LTSRQPPRGEGYVAFLKIEAAQFATAGVPMSFAATDAEHVLPFPPILTAIETCPLSEESFASACM